MKFFELLFIPDNNLTVKAIRTVSAVTHEGV
jgi:hypothetical protein